MDFLTNIVIDGTLTVNTIAAGVSDYDRFLVSDGGLIKYRTGAQLLSDIGAQASGNYLLDTTDTFTGTLTIAGALVATQTARIEGGSEILQLKTSGLTGSNYQTWTDAAGRKGFFGFASLTDEDIYLSNEEAGSIRFGTSPAYSDFVVNPSKNVGLGIYTMDTVYGKLFQIHSPSTTGAELRLTDSTSGTTNGNGTILLHSGTSSFLWNRETGFLSLGATNEEAMRIHPSLNVSIGSTVDNGQKLEVTGNVLATSHITSGGTSSQFVKGDGSLDTNTYATTTGIGSEVEEENNFAGGETNWVLSGTPSASYPHRLYAGTTSGGGLILLDEGVDYTLVGSTITYLSPVLPIDSDEKHIIQYNTATVPLTYPTPYADVIYRNSDMWEAVDSSAYYFKDRVTFDQRNLQLFIMTDIHGDVDRLTNGITLMNQFDTIDGGLNMGDTCLDTWLDDFTFADPFHTIGKPVLISIGNHDEGTGTLVSNTGSTAASYARFIQPYEANIGGVHTGKSYYYKDWTTYKIRTINLYDMDDNDDLAEGDPTNYRVAKTHRIWSQAQLDWLEATLTSTPTDYAIIVISHYPIEDQPNITVDYTCKLTDPKIVNWDVEANYVVGNPIADMMEAWITGTASGALSYALSGSTGAASYKPNLTVNVDFISRGTGHFITYLCGHVHQDGVGDLTGYTTQKIITINCTTSDKNRNKYGSTQRKPGTRSEDLLTTMSFDTVNRQIKVVRLGAQFFTEDMRKMDYTTIDY